MNPSTRNDGTGNGGLAPLDRQRELQTQRGGSTSPFAKDQVPLPVLYRNLPALHFHCTANERKACNDVQRASGIVLGSGQAKRDKVSVSGRGTSSHIAERLHRHRKCLSNPLSLSTSAGWYGVQHLSKPGTSSVFARAQPARTALSVTDMLNVIATVWLSF